MSQATYIFSGGGLTMELLQIKILNTAVERIMNQEMSELGMTYTQSTVIGYLLEHQDKDVCQRDIEYCLGLNHSTVSSILGRMEANRMICIETSPSDRRYKRVSLTEKAISQSEQIGEKYKKVKKILFHGISAEQRDQINTTINELIKNIEQE
jgi:DNA-binding MarR family transcriptional regulator